MNITFDYPINTGRIFLGNLRVSATADPEDAELIRIQWQPANLDTFVNVTELIRQWPAMWEELEAAACDFATPDEIDNDYTLMMQND